MPCPCGIWTCFTLLALPLYTSMTGAGRGPGNHSGCRKSVSIWLLCLLEPRPVVHSLGTNESVFQQMVSGPHLVSQDGCLDSPLRQTVSCTVIFVYRFRWGRLSIQQEFLQVCSLDLWLSLQLQFLGPRLSQRPKPHLQLQLLL